MCKFIDNITKAEWSTWWTFVQTVAVVGGLGFAGCQLSQTASSLRANNGYSIFRDWSNIYTSALSNANFYKYFVLDETVADPSITRDAKQHARMIMSFNAAVFEVVQQKWAPEKAWIEQASAVCDLLNKKNFSIYYREHLRGLLPKEYPPKIQSQCNETKPN